MNELIGKNLRFLIRSNAVSINEVAAQLNHDVNWIVDLQENKREPELSDIISIADFFKISIDRLIKKDLSRKPKDIRLLVLDVDGVMTDGGMIFDSSGNETKVYNTKDGMAIKEILKRGVDVGFISSGFSDALVRNRAEMLGVTKVYVGTENKLHVLNQWVIDFHIPMHEVVYIGDDINDLPCIEAAGFSACPADAVEKIKNAADVVLESKGGKGCVREFVEEYLFEL